MKILRKKINKNGETQQAITYMYCRRIQTLNIQKNLKAF